MQAGDLLAGGWNQTGSQLTFSITPSMQPYLNERAPVRLCIVSFNQTVDPSAYLLLGISVQTPVVTLSDWDTVKRYLGVWSHLGTNDVVKNERDSSDRGDIDFFSYDAECSFRGQNACKMSSHYVLNYNRSTKIQKPLTKKIRSEYWGFIRMQCGRPSV